MPRKVERKSSGLRVPQTIKRLTKFLAPTDTRDPIEIAIGQLGMHTLGTKRGDGCNEYCRRECAVAHALFLLTRHEFEQQCPVTLVELRSEIEKAVSSLKRVQDLVGGLLQFAATADNSLGRSSPAELSVLTRGHLVQRFADLLAAELKELPSESRKLFQSPDHRQLPRTKPRGALITQLTHALGDVGFTVAEIAELIDDGEMTPSAARVRKRLRSNRDLPGD